MPLQMEGAAEKMIVSGLAGDGRGFNVFKAVNAARSRRWIS